MTTAVKLTRLKSRAKRKGRPKYKYVLRWEENGKWQQESCQTSDRVTAKAMRDRRFAELNHLVTSDNHEPEQAPLSWRELEQRNQVSLQSRGKAKQTIEGYSRSVRFFRDLTDAEHPCDVTEATIEQFIAARRKIVESPATINRDLTQLRAVFNRAIRRNELIENPFGHFDKLFETQKEIRILSRKEIQAVCKFFADAPLLQTFLLISLQTGCRIRELAYLLSTDIEPDSGWLMIRNKTLPDGREWRVKTSASIRDVWLPPWLMCRLISLQLPRKPFVWSQHLADIGRAFHATFDPERFVPFVQHQIVGCCETTGILRFSHHDCRRTQQTWLREHGWGDAICLAVAGQNTGATVLRNHYWKPNHRRMTKPAFEDVTGIFLESAIVSGDPLGDTCGLKPEFERGQIVATQVG